MFNIWDYIVVVDNDILYLSEGHLYHYNIRSNTTKCIFDDDVIVKIVEDSDYYYRDACMGFSDRGVLYVFSITTEPIILGTLDNILDIGTYNEICFVLTSNEIYRPNRGCPLADSKYPVTESKTWINFVTCWSGLWALANDDRYYLIYPEDGETLSVDLDGINEERNQCFAFGMNYGLVDGILTISSPDNTVTLNNVVKYDYQHLMSNLVRNIALTDNGDVYVGESYLKLVELAKDPRLKNIIDVLASNIPEIRLFYNLDGKIIIAMRDNIINTPIVIQPPTTIKRAIS